MKTTAILASATLAALLPGPASAQHERHAPPAAATPRQEHRPPPTPTPAPGHEQAKPAGSHFVYFIAAPYSDGREKEGA